MALTRQQKLDMLTVADSSNMTKQQAVDRNFKILQTTESDESKALATKLAINEMKLNHWIGNEEQWEDIYKTVWIEKFMFVELSMNVSQIVDLGNKLLEGQQKIIAQNGIIISNTGQILNNQVIIIDELGVIRDVTQKIYGQTTEILGTVKDIKGSIDDITANGVKIKQNSYRGGQANYIKYLIYGGIILIVIVFIKKFFGKKK